MPSPHAGSKANTLRTVESPRPTSSGWSSHSSGWHSSDSKSHEASLYILDPYPTAQPALGQLPKAASDSPRGSSARPATLARPILQMHSLEHRFRNYIFWWTNFSALLYIWYVTVTALTGREATCTNYMIIEKPLKLDEPANPSEAEFICELIIDSLTALAMLIASKLAAEEIFEDIQVSCLC